MKAKRFITNTACHILLAVLSVIWVLPIIGGLVLHLITSATVKAPGGLLQTKFAATADTNTKTQVTKKNGHVHIAKNTMIETSTPQKTSKKKD